MTDHLTAEQRVALEPIAAGNGASPPSPEPERWPERRPLDLAVESEPEPPDYLVEALIEFGTANVLSGDTGAAKSFTVADLYVRVANRSPEWLGRELRVRHARAIVVDEENPVRLVRSRARALGLTVEAQGRLRYFHRLGVRLGEEDGDWTEWLRYELEREPADLLVIDTGIAATAPAIEDNNEVASLYTRHLRPLAAEFGVAIVLLLHERKGQPGVRDNRSKATLGARSWIGQADAQLTLSPRGRLVEEPLDEGGYTYEKRFTLEVGKLRDGGAERIEVIRIRSRLDARRALLETEIVNEGEVAADEAKGDAILEEIVSLLAEADEPRTKAELAGEMGAKRQDGSYDRAFERALEDGVRKGPLRRPAKGSYALAEEGLF